MPATCWRKLPDPVYAGVSEKRYPLHHLKWSVSTAVRGALEMLSFVSIVGKKCPISLEAIRRGHISLLVIYRES